MQFTPDLLSSDIAGTEIYNPKTGEFRIKKGPAFSVFLQPFVNKPSLTPIVSYLA
ncbi:MAG: AAA family ATPase [Arcobacteraceae bacterium]